MNPETSTSFSKRLDVMRRQIDEASRRLDLDEKVLQTRLLEQELGRPEIWNNPSHAQTQAKKLSSLQTLVSPWQTLTVQVDDLSELISFDDASLLAEFEHQISALEDELTKRNRDLLFDGPYDSGDAILRLSAGVGGTDAQDFTEMLERMYLRWAADNGFETSLVERSPGETAGIKSSVMEIAGPYAYGKLRSEHGVHRLVRLSPFNSDNLRQTSFAGVEVLPQINAPEDADLKDTDLKIDVYRAGGHGGQSVNTTDSAVRITHIPTGITVSIQNERSQLQNRETALRILRSKLVQLKLEQHAASIDELRSGESASWGAQIRNYVLHPYTLVKDTRTKYEDRDATSVLGGRIDGFIEAYLKHQP